MKHYFKLFLAVGLIGTASFLGCSSSSTPAPVEDVEAVAADVSSLATTPSADISGLDVSLGSGGTTSLIAPSPLTLQASTVVVPRGKSKFLGGGLRETGKSSRAGCDGNMHKKEVFRSGKFAALDRCFPEAMESGGLVTIPTDSYAYYSITPPAESEGNRGGDDGGKLCDEIPDAQADKKADCKSGGSGPSGGTILLRLGRFSDGLRVAMCEGATADAAVLVNEGLYGASGSQYTVDVTRIGNWGGATEEKNFSATIDLGTTGSVTDGVVALGDGSATVTANMNGGFGNGTMTFTATNAVNTVTGGFTGGFTDHFNDCAQTFTGKVFSKFDADSGCSKFSFTGSGMCPQSIANMIPTNLAPADLENFLASFGAELGLMVPLTVDTYQNIKLCPNPNFDPDIVDGTQKPMTVLASGTTCPLFTDAGQEPFAIVTTEQTTDFGTERVQAFTIAASSEYDADCTAVDVDSIVPTAGTIAFGAEKWDCQAEGSFTPVATESLTETQIVALEPAFNKCSLLEEELWNGDGMGGYACDDQDMEGVVDDFSKEGSHDWCDYGGDHRIAPEQDENCPEVLPINCVNPEEGTYCFPGTDGECRDIDLSNEGNSNAISLFATDNGGIDVSLTSVSFAAPCTVPETLLIATFLGGGETTIECMYSCNQPGGFTAPANFDFEGTEGEGGQNQVPAPCEAAGATTQEACEQICSQPQHKEACRFNPDA